MRFAGMLAALCAAVIVLAAPPTARAVDLSGALVRSSDCTQNELPRSDDGYTPQGALPFTINFFGQEYSHLWVNNNGNVTFDGPLSTFTPFGLAGTSRAIIAPFFADGDPRGGGELVRYGYGVTTYEGHRAF